MAEPQEDQDHAVRQEARRWMVRLTSGAATDADAWQLVAWRNLHPTHEAAYREAVHLWKQLGPVAAQQAMLDAEALGRARRLVRRRVLIGGSAIAASVAGILVAGTRLELIPGLGEMLAEYRTGTGERRRLALADGSIIEMNTRTGLSVKYSAAERRIALAGGEATFTVTPDPARPFIVAAAGGETKAVGTIFNVRRDGDDACVTCLEGRVSVEREGRVELGADEQVAYSARGLGQPSTVDPMLATAWREGLLVFRDETLSRVVAELNRYRPGLVLLAGGTRGDQRVSGVFHLDRLDEVIAQIARTSGSQVYHLPGRIVVLRQGNA